MSFYSRLILPLLCRMDPESAHERTLHLLALAQGIGAGRAVLRALRGVLPDSPVKCCGLTFPSVLGIAAGFDKEVRVAPGLAEMGFGHVEVGTLTPLPQAGNPRPRIFRLPRHQAIINRMGFPNPGVEAVMDRLARIAAAPRHYVLGVSLGKQKETPLDQAADDYISVMGRVYQHCDYLAANISSPNTPGLRELQKHQFLENLCRSLAAESASLARHHGMPRRPVLVKIAPDLDDQALDDVLSAITAAGIDGVIATNTTLSRDGVDSPLAGEQGGLSGAPLAGRSTAMIREIHRRTGGRLPIIGVGGILTARDAAEKLDAGATLLQVYSGLVYAGPGMAGAILRGLHDTPTSGK